MGLPSRPILAEKKMQTPKLASTFEFEKFSQADLLDLRDELLHSGVDSWQAAELIGNFLAGRGYGVSNHAARNAAACIDYCGVGSLRSMQEQLEKLARVM
jgi:hypothetical protein